MPKVHFESVTRIKLFGSSCECDVDSVRLCALCGCVDREDSRSPLRHEVTCKFCLKLLMAVTNMRVMTKAEHEASHRRDTR